MGHLILAVFFPEPFLFVGLSRETVGCLVLDYWSYSNMAICEDD